jgi:hypothetical protein
MGIESKDAAIYEVFDSRIAIDKMKQKIADLELMNNRLKAEEARDLENMKTGLAQFTPMQESDIKIENLRIALAEGREAGELLDMPMITALIKDVTDIRSTHERCN